MRASGIDVDSDTKMIYIMELARAGKDFKGELAKTLEKGENFQEFHIMINYYVIRIKGSRFYALLCKNCIFDRIKEKTVLRDFIND